MTDRAEAEDPEGFAMLKFNVRALEQCGLPVMAYPVPVDLLDLMLGEQDQLPFPFLLAGLQALTARGDSAWRQLEPAMERLAELLAPADDRPEVSAAGDTWWLELGDLDLTSPLIVIEREGELVAAIAKRDDGRLRATAFRPLDGKSANMLISLSLKPHPVHGVSMRENNWEFALDSASGLGNTYAAHRGEAYLTYHPDGLATGMDCKPLLPAQIAVQLGVCFAFDT
jgi:hypothetical protein